MDPIRVPITDNYLGKVIKARLLQPHFFHLMRGSRVKLKSVRKA